MEWVYIEDLMNHVGRKVEVRGWLYNKRSSGKIRFFLLRDGTGILQGTVYSPEKDHPLFKVFDKLTQESSLILRGEIKEDKRAQGGYEMAIEDIEVLQIAEEYPITPKEHGTPFLMDHRHLWLRSQKQHAVLQIRTELVRAIRDFFDNRGFRLMDTPILTPSACEGTTTLFETEYFDQKAYLSQSGQLYNEATAMAFGKVYCFGPTFRAEKSKTRKHLIEFWMVEPEIAFAKLADIKEIGEDFIIYIIERALENCKNELEILERDTRLLEQIKKPFPQITYEDAIRLLNEKGNTMQFGDDFGAPEETLLSEIHNSPVCITHFPAEAHPRLFEGSSRRLRSVCSVYFV